MLHVCQCRALMIPTGPDSGTLCIQPANMALIFSRPVVLCGTWGSFQHRPTMHRTTIVCCTAAKWCSFRPLPHQHQARERRQRKLGGTSCGSRLSSDHLAGQERLRRDTITGPWAPIVMMKIHAVAMGSMPSATCGKGMRQGALKDVCTLLPA